jgi:hypothetical protein
MSTARPRPVSDQRLLERALEVTGTDVLSVDELAALLQSAGVELGPDGDERLDDLVNMSTLFVGIGDRGWASSAALLDGTCWTTVVDKQDAADDCLRLFPDLSLIGWLTADVPLRLAAGDVVLDNDGTDDGDDALFGPPGWLAPHAGTLVEVRVDGTTLDLRPARSSPATPASAALVDLIRDWFDRHAVPERLDDRLTDRSYDLMQLGVEDLLWDTLAARRDVYLATVVPPVDELLSAAGLQRHGVVVLRADADPGALGRWHRRNRLGGVHHLDDDELDAADLAIGLSLAATARGDGSLGEPEREPDVARLAAAALEWPMAVRRSYSHARTVGAPGRCALARGPCPRSRR